MIISFKHQFICVQIWKTASTSLEAALYPYAYHFNEFERAKRFVSRKIKLNDRQEWSIVLNTHKHSTAEEIAKVTGSDVFFTFFKFSFVRNPFDLLVSQYKYILDTPAHRHYELAKYLGSFEEYSKWRIDSGNRMLQKYWVCDQEGKQMVDFVGRFERLNEDLAQISKRLGLIVKIPHLNKSSGGGYKQYYKSDELIDFIATNYKEDFEYFGYEMQLDFEQ